MKVPGFSIDFRLTVFYEGERWLYFSPLSYTDADVIVICYSVSDPESLDNVLERWLPEVRHFCPGRPIVLVGNKVDLRPTSTGNPDGDDVIVTSRNFRPEHASVERGERVAEEIGPRRLIECSAKTRYRVRDVFLAATSAAVNARRQRHKLTTCCVL